MSYLAPSTPDPSTTTLILALLRAGLTIAGAVGVTTPAWLTDSALTTIAGALALIAGVVWSLVEKFRAARRDHANSVASAQAGRPVQAAAILAAMLALPLLAACAGSGTVAGGAEAISAAVLPPDQVAQLRTTCASAAPLLAVATAPGLPASIGDTAGYADAYCRQLAALPAGQAPPTTDAGTPTWLPGVIAATRAAAQIAGVVLPLLL